MDTNTLVIGLGILTLLFMILLVIIVVVMFFQLRGLQQGGKGDVTQLAPQIAVLGEKLSHLEPVSLAMHTLHADVQSLGTRMATVENNQNSITQGVGHLATNALSAITELKTLTTGLTDATGAMRQELSRANSDLTQLHAHVKAEQESERQIAESVRRLETIIAGTQTKGVAGENVLELVFSKLPIEWQVRDFKIGGKSVEFALRLPNNLIMPIDSKWAATNLVEQFINTENIQEQQRLKKAIEEAVMTKAKEIRKYLDPSITVNFGVAVLPDAVYDLCSGIQSETFQLNVVLVSYSMFVPYLLLVFQTTLKNSQSIDLHKLDGYLQTAHGSIQAIQDELDGRFSKAITMMNNSRDEMRAIVGNLSGSLTGLQMGAGTLPELPRPVE